MLKGLINIWKHVFKLEGRFTYYLLTSFWFKVFNIEKDKSNKSPLLVFGAIIVIVELLFSLFLNLKYYYVLPTRSFLAAKSNVITTITLLQKFALQIMITYLSKEAQEDLWIFGIVNIVIDITRGIYYFKTLPIYKLEALQYQGSLLMIVFSLNLSVILLAIDSSGLKNSTESFIIIWVIISVLAVKISLAYTAKSFWNLILDPKLKTSGFLIHRISAIKQLRELNKLIPKQKTKNSWPSLAHQTLIANLPKLLNISTSEQFNFNSKDSMNQIFKHYLDKLQNQYPKDHFIQIFKAQFYAKNLNIYGEAIQICQRLRQGYFYTHSLTASILLLTIQKIIKTDFHPFPWQNSFSFFQRSSVKNDNFFSKPGIRILRNLNKSGPLLWERVKENRKLNLWSYFNGKLFVEKIKTQMAQQADLQISISQELKLEKPELSKIFDNAQKFRAIQGKIIRNSQEDFKNLPDPYLEPVLLYAGYHLLLNHSIQDYIYYRKIYTQKLRIYQKAFDQDNILPDNLYQENVGYFLVSVNSINPGAVLYGSKVLENYFGGDSSLYPGRMISTFGPSCLEEIHKTTLSTREEKGATSMIGMINRNFSMRVEGYLVEVDSYIDVFPAVTQGYYWSIVVRPAVKANKDFMYILENGDIDSATKNITEDLALIPSKFHVRDLSEELVKVNEAFNMIAFPEKYSEGKLSQEEAKEIYSVYSTTGKELILSSAPSAHRQPQYFSYNLKITSINLGTFLLKMAIFEKNKTFVNKASEKISEEIVPLAMYHRKTPLLPEVKIKPTEEITEDDFSEELFETEEEKQPHWIDFKAIASSPKSPEKIYSDAGHRETTRHLLLDTVASARNQTTPRLLFAKTNPDDLLFKKLQSNSTTEIEPQRNPLDDKNLFAGEDAKSQISSVHGSKTSQQKRISRVYRNALDEIYSPRSTKILLLVYLILLALLSYGEIALKVRMGSSIDTLRNKKDMIGGAELQNCESIALQSLIRNIWDVKTGFLNSSSFTPYNAYIPPFAMFIAMDFDKLVALNNNLFTNSSLLAQNYRSILFEKDIKIYYNYFDDPVDVFVNMDIFQATNMILQTTKSFLAGTNSQKAKDEMNFISRNALNNLYTKNNIISHIMLESLDQENIYIENGILTNLFTLSGLIITFFPITIHPIIKQYKSQSIRLAAFCRINKIDHILHSFQDFKHVLTSDSPIQTSFFKKRLLASKTQIIREESKKDLSKSPSSTRQRLKFYVPIIWLVIFSLAFIGVIIWASLLYLNFLKSLKGKQELIYFSDAINAKLQLTWATGRELLSTNNTALIEGKLVNIELKILLDDVVDIRQQAYNVLLQDENVKSYEDIKGMIIGDACSLLSTTLSMFCNFLKSQGQKPNLIENLNTFETLLRARLQKYEASDKSVEAAKVIEIADFYLIQDNFIILRGISAKISSLLNESYEEEIKITKSKGSVVLAIFIVYAVLGSFIFWKYIYMRLRDEVNQFKNILRVLPGDVVLSNFILKTFLMKTSNKVLDSIRNDI